MLEMLAAVARTPHMPVELLTVRLDDPRPHELVVEVQAAGICHTDLSGRDQHMPFPLPGVLGHEGAGIVCATGSAVTTVRVGDRVLMTQAFCGTCDACRAGRVTACPNAPALCLSGARADGSSTLTDDAGSEISGGFMGQSSWATHALVREPNVVRLPDNVPWELAAPMACGVQTGAGAVLNLLRPGPGNSLVVFGAGTVGLSAVMAAVHAGCEQIVVVDPQPVRRALAAELGATDLVDPALGDTAAQVQEATRGGADYSVEASGAPSAGPVAVDSLSRVGTCVLLGAPPFGTPLTLDWIGLVSGRTVFGAPYGGGTPSGTVAALLAMRAAGRLPLERLVRTYPFTAIRQAVADMESGATLKPVLIFP